MILNKRKRFPWWLYTPALHGGKKDWWLAGGVDPGDCIAAYQPKGAASYAASKVNLANPGTYNVTPGSDPSWSAANGWEFSGTQWLDTGITPAGDQSWTCIVRFSSASGDERPLLCTVQDTDSHHYEIAANWSNAGVFVAYSGKQRYSSPALSSGVLALAGRQCYLDGSTYMAKLDSATVSIATTIHIADSYRRVAMPINFGDRNIQAVAVYNKTLSAIQIVTLTAAMNAL